MLQAYADNTWKNIQIQHASFRQFCHTFHLQPLPASLTTIQLYCQYLSRKFKSEASIKNYLHGVKILHLWHGHPVDYFHHFSMALLMRGITRNLHHQPRQAHPITLPLLLDMHRHLDLSNPKHVVLWCLLLIAFFMMARKSNLVPDSKFKFDPQKQLTRADIQQHPHMLLITLKWSKTNQFGHRSHQVPLLALPGSPLCPVNAFRHLTRLIPLPHQAPVFVDLHKGTWVPLSYSQYQRRLKTLIAQTGRDPTNYSTHSLRRGGATVAHQAGLTKEHIKLIGDWKSDAVDEYIKIGFSAKLQAAKIMKHYCLLSSV